MAGLLIAVPLLAATTGGSSVRAGFRGLDGKIAFVRGASVYAMKADGTRVRRLTHPKANGRDNDWAPVWSPDGKQLAFTKTSYPTTEKDDLYVVRADGSGLKLLPEGPGLSNWEPVWSPDGRRLAYVSVNGDGEGQVFIESVSGGRARPLGRDHSRSVSVDDRSPAWSPDGTWISFARTVSVGSTGYRLYLIHPDGSGLTKLTDTSAAHPRWSPDSKRIVFNNDKDVFVIDASGSRLKRLTKSPLPDVEPSWSPDGKRVIFARKRSRRGGALSDLWLMNADGSNQHLLIRNGQEPDWQPIP